MNVHNHFVVILVFVDWSVKVTASPGLIVVGAAVNAATGGAVTIIFKESATPLPHPFVPYTLSFPDVLPAFKTI